MQTKGTYVLETEQLSVPSSSDVMPMRINIRVTLKQPKVTDDVMPGTIAPPSSPQMQRLENESLDQRFAVHDKGRLCTPKLHPEDYLKKMYQESLSSNTISSDEEEIVKSKISFPSVSEEDDSEAKPTKCELKAQSAYRMQIEREARRNRVVISPFSERQIAKERLYRSLCRLPSAESTLKTTGGGYFRGKPPLTPFTRLGCYRMQTSKTKLLVLAEPQDINTRCNTAYIPRSAKATLPSKRPKSHAPLSTKESQYDAMQRLIQPRRKNMMKLQDILASHNHKSESNVIHSEKPPEKVESTTLKPHPIYGPFKNNGLVRNVVTANLASENSTEEPRSAPNDSHKKPSAVDRSKLRSENIPKTANVSEDSLTIYKRLVHKTQPSPFRRTLKINQPSDRWRTLPPSTKMAICDLTNLTL